MIQLEVENDLVGIQGDKRRYEQGNVKSCWKWTHSNTRWWNFKNYTSSIVGAISWEL
jgi:hypothetical protein